MLIFIIDPNKPYEASNAIIYIKDNNGTYQLSEYIANMQSKILELERLIKRK